MDGEPADPRCPECGGPIGERATYCMHCSADLTEELEAADVDDDGAWEQGAGRPSPMDGAGLVAWLQRLVSDTVGGGSAEPAERGTAEPARDADSVAAKNPTTERATRRPRLLDPDGLVDDTLTVVVGIAGGFVVGLLATIELAVLTGSGWALLLGLAIWLGSTAYFVRRRTVQGAVAASGYGVAIVLLLVPILAFSPVAEVQGGLEGRGNLFLVLSMFVFVPVAVAGIIGWIASHYVPEGRNEGSPQTADRSGER